MSTYRNPPSLPAAGDVLWTVETEPARLVRVLHVEEKRAWVQPIASMLQRSTPLEVAVSSLQVQVGSERMHDGVGEMKDVPEIAFGNIR